MSTLIIILCIVIIGIIICTSLVKKTPEEKRLEDLEQERELLDNLSYRAKAKRKKFRIGIETGI